MFTFYYSIRSRIYRKIRRWKRKNFKGYFLEINDCVAKDNDNYEFTSLAAIEEWCLGNPELAENANIILKPNYDDTMWCGGFDPSKYKLVETENEKANI